MAPINKFILEYKDTFRDLEIDFDNSKPPEKTMRRFIRLLKKIDDVRATGMIDYPLEEIVGIVFLAVLGNATGWQEITLFGKVHQKWLGKFLRLEKGIPSHDTFRRVFSLIKSEQLVAITVAFLAENIDKIKKSLKIDNQAMRHICVDGKEGKGTGRKHNTSEEIRNLQTLHIYDNSNGICLYSEMIDSKTNEIPVAQKILSSLELKNSIVSFDAMNTQQKTVEIIITQKGEYVGALKGNHKVFEEEVGSFFNQAEMEKIEKKDEDYYKTTEKSHNQVETREFFLTRDIKWFQELPNWRGLKSFVCYKRRCLNVVTGKVTTELRYYIASISDVKLCADVIRGHWGVENTLHWHLDVNFYEDDNTTMDKNAFNNLSIINKMVLSLLKLAQPIFDNRSIRSMRKEFSWKLEDNLSKVLNFFDEDDLLGTIEKAIQK
jgi:predicted transposase YbfD/YdcC